MECPLCYGQGLICRATIVKLNKSILICDECDAMWLEQEKISETDFDQFEFFMKEKGLPGLWSELMDINRNWNK